MKNEIAKTLLPARIYEQLRRRKYRKLKSNVYSCKVFEEKKAVFIHIPKCAGISTNQTLFGNLGGGHRTLEEYVELFGEDRLSEYFKFTIVRNPWDRLVSAYFFLKKGGLNETNRLWFDKELGIYDGFDDFVLNWVNETNIWKTQHFRPQVHYIIDPQNRVQLDFIGYLENINEDFAMIAKRVGVRRRLPAHNKSSHTAYTEYYTDDARERVANVYAKDIKLLGYNFDNSSLPNQLKNRPLTDDASSR